MKMRILLAAIATIMLAGEARSQSQPPQEPRSEQEQRTAGDSRATDQPPAIEVISAATDEADTGEEQRERQRQAVNEGRMVLLTFALVVFAALQAGFTFITLRGLRYARRSAEAAESSIATIQKTSRAQLRAYLYVLDARVTDVKGGGPIKYAVTVRNGGATPAYDFTHQTGSRIRPPDTTDFVLKPGIPLSRSTLGPGATSDIVSQISRENWNQFIGELMDGRLVLFIIGEIKYRDAFGEHHFATYRFRLPNEGGVRDAVLIACEDGNDAD